MGILRLAVVEVDVVMAVVMAVTLAVIVVSLRITLYVHIVEFACFLKRHLGPTDRRSYLRTYGQTL